MLLLIPQYLLLDRLHLIDSLVGLVLLYVSSNLPFMIFFLRGFFSAIPREYEEAFRLDGAGTLRVIVRPDRPAVVASTGPGVDVHFQHGLGRVPARLDDAQYAVALHAPDRAGGLHPGPQDVWGPFFAASVIATVPVVVVFVVTQRWSRSGYLSRRPALSHEWDRI